MNKPTIIANGIVLTCDPANHCGHYNILVSSGRILSISDSLESLTTEHPYAEILDARDTLIVPGFVNAHYHGESFLFRALTTSAHFGLWKKNEQLKQASEKLLHSSSYEDVRRLYAASYFAHVKSGTTCVGEYPPLLDENAFIHMLEGIALTGVTSVVTLQNWEQIQKVRSMREQSLKVAVNLGEEEDFTVYSIEKISQAAKELNAPLLAHVAEQREDVDVVRKNFQKDILALLNSFNVIQQNTIFVHANHTSEDDIMRVRDVGGAVVISPRSTAAKQTGYPSLRHLAKQNIRLALGTDWSNVDMLEEMRFLCQLPLIVPGLPLFPPIEILRAATINGATALGVGNAVGSIEVGKRADFVFFAVADVRLPVMRPSATAEQWASVLVQHLTAGDIDSVMVNGDIKVKDGAGVLFSEAEIVREFRALYERFIPDGVLPPMQTDQTTNVLPFVSELPATQKEIEGFESGFQPQESQGSIAGNPVNPLVNRPKVKREPIKPELPKTTRRVFGDDEEL